MASHVSFPNLVCSIISFSVALSTVFRAPSMRHDFQKSNKESMFAALTRLVGLWLARSSERRTLTELEPFRLDDIGIGEAERRRECRKRFWES
jgi:uncharacterized protein YjiS (DUF1127 family)